MEKQPNFVFHTFLRFIPAASSVSNFNYCTKKPPLARWLFPVLANRLRYEKFYSAFATFFFFLAGRMTT